MKNLILILCIFTWLTSCTLASKNKHYRLAKHQDKVFEKLDAKWCFISAMDENIRICSPSFEQKSTSYGILLPIIPLKNSDSRYAYDYYTNRKIEVFNLSLKHQVKLPQLNEVLVCDLIVQDQCIKKASLVIEPNSYGIIQLPETEEIKVLFEVNDHIFYEKFEQFMDKHWSFVPNKDY